MDMCKFVLIVVMLLVLIVIIIIVLIVVVLVVVLLLVFVIEDKSEKVAQRYVLAENETFLSNIIIIIEHYPLPSFLL